MNTTPSVSIIMPVYNTESYVDIAIRSVIQQELQDFELLLINDGSTDGSLMKLEEWALKDERIHVFSQDNQGPSAARNRGILSAKGKYIYFLDSDDTIVPATLTMCLSKCENHHLDFVFFDAISFGGSYSHITSYLRKGILNEDVKSGVEWFKEQLAKDCFRTPVWLNFIRLSHLKEQQLYFVPMLHEDEVFTPLLYCLSSRVGYIAEPFFQRRLRYNSIMTADYSLINYDYYLQAADNLLKCAKKIDKDSAYLIKIHVVKMLNAATYRAHILTFSDKIKIMKRIIPRWCWYIKITTLFKLFFK